MTGPVPVAPVRSRWSHLCKHPYSNDRLLGFPNSRNGELERVEEWSLRDHSREGQELSAVADVVQLILKMSSEYQTVDHRNKFMGNDHVTIFV